ncbi:BON domain-containing protein [Tunturiibacter gelidoferens]|uniref:BON domain-containing protein n=1 Tax=Tunturiibacter gelidiferens TaxID=3069689 RepID=A0AAU7YUC7_9BACT
MMKIFSLVFPGLLMVVLAGCNTKSSPVESQSAKSTPGGGAVSAATDATVNSDVKAKLAADETVGPMALDAQTQNKVVTLTGTVDSQATKDKAMMVARQVNGVSSVVDQMTVGPAGCCNHKAHPMPGHGDGMGMQPSPSH